MKYITVLLILISFSFDIFGQADTVFMKYNSNQYDDSITYKTDTILFNTPLERHILMGTTILPSTHNQLEAWGHGLYIKKVEKTECKNNEHPIEKNKILSIFKNDSVLTVETTIYDNCCYSFLCDAAVDSASILNLIFNGYGTFCSCYCCFGLKYYFEILKNPDYPEIKAIMINGDRKTLKMVKK